MKINKKRLRGVAAVVLVLALVVSGGLLLYKHIGYSRGARDYERAAALAGVAQLRAPEQDAGTDADSDETPVDPFAAALAGTDLGALRETNEEVLAWIAIPDTGLSYPVMKCDNNSYYLNRTWSRERSDVGSVFMECQCAADFSDFNTIIYAHRMNNESMFGILNGYADAEFWRAHPKVYIAADDGVRVYSVYAAFEAGTRDVIYRLGVTDEDMKQECIDYGLAQSVIDTGIAPAPGDQILTLSTCTERGSWGRRWVVQAVLE